MPNLDKIKDEGTKNVVKDINKIIQDTNRDVLDDLNGLYDDLNGLYEEGDWTAAFVCGTSGTITINNSYKTGHYVKIGKQVTVTGWFVVTSVSSPVGRLSISGLPFALGTGNKYCCSANSWSDRLVSGSISPIMPQMFSAESVIYIDKFIAGNYAELAADVQASTTFLISATYFTE
jgi:hypothetical protein